VQVVEERRFENLDSVACGRLARKGASWILATVSGDFDSQSDSQRGFSL